LGQKSQREKPLGKRNFKANCENGEALGMAKGAGLKFKGLKL